MPIAPKTWPVRFTARGLCDAFDATDKFPGACMLLSNLIFDQSNPEIMVSRPGVTAITTFPGFASPGVVSVQVTVAGVTYGLIGSARNAGKDEPFAYDNVAGAFLVVAGVTNGNTPVTPAPSGPWTPPTMASVGTKILVTHPGFPGGATKFGWFDISVPGAPTWSAGDLATNALPSVPVSVANFFNRAYYACGNASLYSDILDPLTRTLAAQSITVGDQSIITSQSGLPIQTTSGGITQALIIFKDFQTWQVTGDTSTLNLSLNFMSLTVGCFAPRSIAQSPLGLYFASISGPFVIDTYGILRSLTHSPNELEPDILAAWQNAVVPTRISGGYTGTMYRICMETLVQGVDQVVDYWFDEHKRRWTGPHTFTYDCTSQRGNFFILCSNAAPGALYKSEIIPSINSVYADAGTAITVTLKSSTFPKTGDMDMKQVVESTEELASAGGATSYNITALDDLGNTINSCQISVLPAGTLWGAGVWGGFTWASSVNIPTTYNVPWTIPIVFKKMALYITAAASTSLALGTFFARYQNLGYTNIR